MDNIFLVFDYCAYDLASLVERMSRPFLESEVKQILLQLLEAVEYLHANFIVHRDLKLSNLLVDDKGRLKVGGTARAAERLEGRSALAAQRLPAATCRRHRARPLISSPSVLGLDFCHRCPLFIFRPARRLWSRSPLLQPAARHDAACRHALVSRPSHGLRCAALGKLA